MHLGGGLGDCVSVEKRSEAGSDTFVVVLALNDCFLFSFLCYYENLLQFIVENRSLCL